MAPIHYLHRMIHNPPSAGFGQFLTAPKTPADPDGTHPGIGSRLHVHIRVAYVNHLGRLQTQLLANIEDRFRLRLHG